MGARRCVPLPHRIDVARTLGPLRVGRHDPTTLLGADTVLRAMRTPEGPATLRAEHRGDRFDVEAWGPGADWALHAAPGLLGCLDDPSGLRPHHPAVERAVRLLPGLCLPRTGLVVEALVAAVLGQRVTGFEARRSFRLLVERWGEPAPGPGRLTLLPDVAVIADLGYYDLHVIGLERTRAEALGRVAAQAGRLQHAVDGDPAALRTRVEAIPGVGRWTSAEVARIALGDADAVRVGDHNLKHLVSWALAGEPRGTDERMLELLEPYDGQRGRACGLLEAAGLHAPRRGPRRRIEPTAPR